MNPTTLEAVHQVPVVRAAATPTRLADFMTLTKPGITVMVTITAAVGYYVASHGSFDWKIFLHMVGGTLLSSAGAAAFNMLMERKLDALMDRTKARPLAAGRMAPVEAAVFGGVLCVAGLSWLALKVNLLTAALSAATMFSYLALYTPLKTKSSVCTLVGAIPGALPPVMGWAASRGSVDVGAGVLFLILFFWQLPHFLALAWMYREDYARGGFPMLPVEEPTGASTGRQVVLQTLALVVVSLLPFGFQMAGEGYLIAALVLGTAFLGFGVAFAAERSRDRASRLFLASITYLPLLLGALALL
ncbi:MAG TPA: heme o synthase [Planctomycetota bacterium]|nr:heme o synthase [Planctomycetota bacterium]